LNAARKQPAASTASTANTAALVAGITHTGTRFSAFFMRTCESIAASVFIVQLIYYARLPPTASQSINGFLFFLTLPYASLRLCGKLLRRSIKRREPYLSPGPR
jgi:hypothetical protein